VARDLRRHGSVRCSLPFALLAIATPAAADPSFVEAGATAGGTHEGDVYAGFLVGGGVRVSDHVWAHGAAASGTAPVLHFAGIDQYEGTHDSFVEARGGVELRGCTDSKTVCAIGGVDIGYRHEKFDDAMMTVNRSSAEAVARFGLDIGARQLRVRPVVEGTSTHTGDTTALSIGVAYLW
jgi:hypothetical protein